MKIFGICDSNADPFWFDYPVAGNDDGIKSIKLICETVIKAYGQGKKELGINNEADRVKAEKDKVTADAKAQEELNASVAEETAAIEEKIEKEVVSESEKKV